MIRPATLISICLALSAAAVAWQGGIALVGLTDADAQNVARNFFASSDSGLPGPYFLNRAMLAQWKAKGGAERAQAVREMAAYARRLVSTPAFAATYSAWIKERYHAVDHGMKIDAAGDAAKLAANPDAAMSQMRNTMAAAITQSFSQLPAPSLKMMFDQDLENWKGDPDKARLLSRARQIAPLAASKPEEFKKQYMLLKSADMGGP